MKRKIVLIIPVIAAIAFIVYAKNKSDDFSLAEDFPRKGALIYVQTSDLPSLIKLWNESAFKEKYLESTNFDELKNRHLGRKLASRWQEFSDAVGLPVDLETVAGLATDKAAITVYDIGKLDFVFIAPVSGEFFSAAKLFQNKDKFIEQILDDGTTVYRVPVEADRGRQKQELIFTNVKNRFVLATSEKLLVATLDNLNGKTAQNKLSAAPEFSLLREKAVPHLATVWVNQAALNDDYYFKRYWLMSDAAKLKNFRAGMFDFDREDGKLIEKRKFLLANAVNTPPLDKALTSELLAFVPGNIPFFRIQSAKDNNAAEAIENAAFERSPNSGKSRQRDHSFSDYDYADDETYSNEDYEDLSAKFDQNINETDEPEEAVENRSSDINLNAILQPARSQAALTFTDPQTLPFPLFAEFHRAAVVNLAAPENFNRDAFESAVTKKFASKLLIFSSGATPEWQTKSENGFVWRELNFPMIGQSASYFLARNHDLIVTNDAGFLRKIIETETSGKSNKTFSTDFSELTFVDFTQRTKACDEIFNQLQEKNTEPNFFTGNIESLLDSLSDVKNAEFKKNYDANFLEEELTLRY